MGDLAEQIQDLQDTIELLTLDKEQLQLDKELLEEQLQQAQEQIHRAAHTSTNSIDAATLQQIVKIQDENSQLHDTLRTLRESSTSDKTLIEAQRKQITDLQAQVNDLTHFKSRAELEMEDMKQTIDSISSFEGMIEKLTSENLDLSSALAEAKQTIHDLEDGAELTEELDQQQRQQIEEDRKMIEQVNISLQTFERIVADKDTANQELQKKLDTLRQKYVIEKEQVEVLQQQLSLGNQDSKQIEEKLRESSSLRTQREILRHEVYTLQNQLISSNSQKFRYQTLFNRMNEYFGGTSFFIEENKLVTMEILYINTIATSMESGKQLANLYVALSHRSSGGNDMGLTVPHVQHLFTRITTCYNLSIPLHALIVQSSLTRIKEQSRELLSDKSLQDAAALNTQWMQSTRSVLEQIQNITSKLVPVWSAYTTAVQDMMEREHPDVKDDEAVMHELEMLAEYMSLSEFIPQCDQLVDALSKSLATYDRKDVDVVEKKEELRVTTLLEGAIDLFSSKEEDALTNAIVSEFLFVATSALIDALFTQSHSNAAGLEVVKTLKSLLDEIAHHFKAYSTVATRHKQALTTGFIELLRVFSPSDKVLVLTTPLSSEIEANLRSIAGTLRVIIADMKINPSSSSSKSSNVVILKYYPTIMFVNTIRGGQPRDEQGLNEQFHYLLERYWGLILQGENELLNATAYSSTRRQSIGDMGTSASSSTQELLAWKDRVFYYRNIIMMKLDIDAEAMLKAKQQQQQPFAKEDKKKMTPEQVLEKEIRSLKHQLEMKQDEVRAALNRCEEFQQLLNRTTPPTPAPSQAASRPITAVSSMTDLKSLSEESSALARLQEINKALEEAIEATEKKYDDVVKENKALKATAATTSVASKGTAVAGSVATKEPAKIPKNKTSMSVFEATKALILANQTGGSTTTASGTTATAASTLGAASTKASTTTIAASAAAFAASSAATGGLIDESNYSSMERNLLEQLRYWRAMALKRLTSSLKPLPPVGSLRSEDGSSSTTVPIGSGTLVLSVPKVQGGSADLRDAYCKLRLERVKAIQVKAIGEKIGQEDGLGRPRRKLAAASTLTNIIYKLQKEQQISE